MGTLFMEKSYVLASIFVTKQIYLRESFLTLEECNIISNVLQHKFNKQNLDVIITDEIDNEYYKIVDGVIFINKEKGYCLEGLKYRYQCFLLNRARTLKIVWDYDFILEQIKMMKF